MATKSIKMSTANFHVYVTCCTLSGIVQFPATAVGMASNQPLSVISVGDKFDPLFDLEEAESWPQVSSEIITKIMFLLMETVSQLQMISCTRAHSFVYVTFGICKYYPHNELLVAQNLMFAFGLMIQLFLLYSKCLENIVEVPRGSGNAQYTQSGRHRCYIKQNQPVASISSACPDSNSCQNMLCVNTYG